MRVPNSKRVPTSKLEPQILFKLLIDGATRNTFYQRRFVDQINMILNFPQRCVSNEHCWVRQPPLTTRWNAETTLAMEGFDLMEFLLVLLMLLVVVLLPVVALLLVVVLLLLSALVLLVLLLFLMVLSVLLVLSVLSVSSVLSVLSGVVGC